MKCRIWYRPTAWMAFDAPDPCPWKLSLPTTLKLGPKLLWPVSEYRTFDGALKAFQYLLEMHKKGWLHR